MPNACELRTRTDGTLIISERAQPNDGSLIARARSLATAAHHGQVDKAGAAYIGHPARVAAGLTDDPQACAVAWLHDVVEDCDITLNDLLAQGFPGDVVTAVDALTRRDGEEPSAYYQRVTEDPLALKVKYADLDDNSDPKRLAVLDAPTRNRLIAKYAKARESLAAFGNRTAATMKTSEYYVEYHGEKYRERFDSDVWVAVESGPGGASQFPEALEFGSTRGAAWAKLPLRAVTRRWSERVHGLWNDVPVTVFRGGEEGTVLITFVGLPATAKQLGFEGDQHQGWTLTVPEPEVRITDVQVRERPVESA